MAIYRNLYMINNNREQVPSTFCLLCVNLVCYWEGIRVIFSKTTNVDINFVSKIAGAIDDDPEPKSMTEWRKRSDWFKWKKSNRDGIALTF